MGFRIADTFTDSLARLSGKEQKAVKTTAFDPRLNPANPGMQFRRLDKPSSTLDRFMDLERIRKSFPSGLWFSSNLTGDPPAKRTSSGPSPAAGSCLRPR